jgi:hypothetical protein
LLGEGAAEELAFVLPDEFEDGGVEEVGEALTVGGSSGSGGALSAPGAGVGVAGSARLSAAPDETGLLPSCGALGGGTGASAGAGAMGTGLEVSGAAAVFLFLFFFDLCVVEVVAFAEGTVVFAPALDVAGVFPLIFPFAGS